MIRIAQGHRTEVHAAALQGAAAVWSLGLADHQVQRGRVASDIHVGFVELRDPAHLQRARIGFPLYLVLIALPTLPLAWAGRELLITLFMFVTAPVSANLLAEAALHLRVRSEAPLPDGEPRR